MSYSIAQEFCETVLNRVKDASRGNIFVHCLNVVKAGCMLVELLEKVKRQFSFMNRRVDEIRQKIISICFAFMLEVGSEEEMRFLLLEKDLDSRDSLNLINQFNMVELLKHPFA